MYKNDLMRVDHILDAAREVIDFTRNREKSDLEKDRLLNLGAVRLLEIIGEAARGISQEFKDRHPGVAWKQMAGMRDRLIHGYYDVNLDVVWETISQDLPLLIEQLEKIKKQER